MSTYAPTVEQAARVGTLLARLDDPRELQRIAGIGSKAGNGINRADLPSLATIRKYTVSIAPRAPKLAGKVWQKPGNRPANQIITAEEGDRIKALAKSGLTAPKIALHMDIHPTSIRYWAQRHGVKIKAAARRIFTPQMEARARELQSSGVHLNAASRALGINNAVLSGWEQRTGLRFVRVYSPKRAQAA